MPKFNGEELTQESILRTRLHLASNAQACIDEVKVGLVKVNDPESYFAWCRGRVEDALAGKNDHTFTFLQRAYWIQTGKSIALLP